VWRFWQGIPHGEAVSWANVPAVVYFIQSGEDGPIKIGWTSTGNPWGRCAALQTGSPEELEVVGFFVGPQSEERRLHEKFAEHRIRGEWFAPVHDLKVEIGRSLILLRHAVEIAEMMGEE